MATLQPLELTFRPTSDPSQPFTPRPRPKTQPTTPTDRPRPGSLLDFSSTDCRVRALVHQIETRALAMAVRAGCNPREPLGIQMRLLLASRPIRYPHTQAINYPLLQQAFWLYDEYSLWPLLLFSRLKLRKRLTPDPLAILPKQTHLPSIQVPPTHAQHLSHFRATYFAKH